LQKVTLVEQNKPLTILSSSTKNPIVTQVADFTPIQRYHCHPHWMLVDWCCPRHAQEMVRSCAKIKLPHHLPFSPKIEMQHKSRSCRAMFRQTIKKTLCKHHEFSVNLT